MALPRLFPKFGAAFELSHSTGHVTSNRRRIASPQAPATFNLAPLPSASLRSKRTADGGRRTRSDGRAVLERRCGEGARAVAHRTALDTRPARRRFINRSSKQRNFNEALKRRSRRWLRYRSSYRSFIKDRIVAAWQENASCSRGKPVWRLVRRSRTAVFLPRCSASAIVWNLPMRQTRNSYMITFIHDLSLKHRSAYPRVKTGDECGL
jgi:hypothetical protein